MRRRALLTAGPLWLLGIRQAAALPVSEDHALLDGLAARLFQRECGGRQENLIWWAPREPFPSLGIAHFIWLPAGVQVPFEQTFPQMVRFVGGAPDWVRGARAPWLDRRAFVAEGDSVRLRHLRDWLWRTRRRQALFVVRRFQQRWRRVVGTLPDGPQLAARLQRLMGTSIGLFAVLDYFNFKGMGDHPEERYQGRGWGLIQVLRQMHTPTLAAFVEAAEQVLRQRIRLAPRDEQHWWPGWRKRVRSYLEAT